MKDCYSCAHDLVCKYWQKTWRKLPSDPKDPVTAEDLKSLSQIFAKHCPDFLERKEKDDETN